MFLFKKLFVKKLVLYASVEVYNIILFIQPFYTIESNLNQFGINSILYAYKYNVIILYSE